MLTVRNAKSVFAVLLVLVVVLSGIALVPVLSAQDDAPVVCDSTLVTLLLVAEHDYDYLSAKMDMGEEVPNIDLGQYGPVMDAIVAMMMAMMDEEDDMGMDEMDMAAHDQMLADMMAMDSVAAVAAYMGSMGMEMGADMTTLAPGAVAGEDPLCTQVRADVEQFILAHILTEMSMMSMEGM